MRIVRMFVILIVLSLGGGLFGAGIGGLVGYGFPRSISGQYEVDEAKGPEGAAKVETSSKGVRVGVGEQNDVIYAKKGAALGAAIGLCVGIVLGLLLALVDQFMVQIVEWMGKRKQKSDLTTSG